MAAKKGHPSRIRIFLLLILVLFAALIFLLDQKIVQQHQTDTDQKKNPDENRTKPIIDFYTILPDRKVEITPREDPNEGTENPDINSNSANKVLLQVGSFQSEREADSLKAELAFLGLEAKVKSARVKNNTWYRVQIGPFTSNTALSQMKNQLLKNNIKYIQRPY